MQVDKWDPSNELKFKMDSSIHSLVSRQSIGIIEGRWLQLVQSQCHISYWFRCKRLLLSKKDCCLHKRVKICLDNVESNSLSASSEIGIEFFFWPIRGFILRYCWFVTIYRQWWNKVFASRNVLVMLCPIRSLVLCIFCPLVLAPENLKVNFDKMEMRFPSNEWSKSDINYGSYTIHY